MMACFSVNMHRAVSGGSFINADYQSSSPIKRDDVDDNIKYFSRFICFYVTSTSMRSTIPSMFFTPYASIVQ